MAQFVPERECDLVRDGEVTDHHATPPFHVSG